jgi:hypothetical protein
LMKASSPICILDWGSTVAGPLVRPNYPTICFKTTY